MEGVKLAQGQVLELPDASETTPEGDSIRPKTLEGIVLDDGQAKLSGSWSRSTNFKPYIGNGYIFSGEKDSKSKGDGKTTATFRFNVPQTGSYQLLMAYSPHASRAKNIPVTISSGTGQKTFLVDQTMPHPAGKYFSPVATVKLYADEESVIQVTNADTIGFVILDALQLRPVVSKRN